MRAARGRGVGALAKGASAQRRVEGCTLGFNTFSEIPQREAPALQMQHTTHHTDTTDTIIKSEIAPPFRLARSLSAGLTRPSSLMMARLFIASVPVLAHATTSEAAFVRPPAVPLARAHKTTTAPLLYRLRGGDHVDMSALAAARTLPSALSSATHCMRHLLGPCASVSRPASSGNSIPRRR